MIRLLAFLALLLATPAAGQVTHQPWTRNATIYELNVRQFSPEGTIAAAAKQLPRLKRMGVTIVWVMPVQPIGEKERKGPLGSYYSIRDYQAVDPAFGTLTDLKAFVRQAHGLGMKVILDWVANHTAWDHPWATAHPEWYQRGPDGKLRGYEYDNGREIEHWSDVIGLDYRNPGVAPAMIAAMRWWLVETDIDGFRADVAMRVPLAFWLRARAELERVKPQFWLAEADGPELHRAFDMTYGWSLKNVLIDIAAGKAKASALKAWADKERATYPADAYRMLFTSNHDENSWQGSDLELYRGHLRTFAVLAATLPGMPLVYNGQESGLNKRLKFFERDPVDWGRYALQPFYTRLLTMKRPNPALRNGAEGAPLEWLPTGDDRVIAYRRMQGRHGVTVAANLSDAPKAVTLPGIGRVTLRPWDYRLRSW